MIEKEHYIRLNKLASMLLLFGFVLALCLAAFDYRDLATSIAPFLIILLGLCGILGFKSGSKVWVGGYPVLESASEGARQGALILNILIVVLGIGVLFK